MKQMNKKFLRVGTRLFVVVFGIALLVAIAEVAIAQPPPPVTFRGTVTYADGTSVPDDWNVTISVEDKDYAELGEPWTTTTQFIWPCWCYSRAGSVFVGDVIKVHVQSPDMTYAGSNTGTYTGTYTGMTPMAINVTVSPTGVTPPPVTETPPATPGGASPVKTPKPTPIEEAKTYKNIAAGEEVKVELLGKELGITFKKEVPEAKITAKEFVEKPADVPDAPGIVFKYLEYNIENVSPEDIEKITIPFDVPKSWIASENVDPATIKLNRYYNGVWNPLPTEKVSEDAEYMHYFAEAEGLSIFAITGEKKTEVEVPAPAPAPATAWVWVVVGAVLVVLVVSAGVWYMKKRKRE
jgi:PGF-pre-PGF domain-containing protein